MSDTGEGLIVAAFDFDGTLSTRDNVVPFLVRVGGAAATASAFATAATTLLPRGPSAWSRNRLKEEVTHHLFAGRHAREVDSVARAFAVDVVDRHLRDEAVGRVRWHRQQGHRVVIVSASFGIYLRPVADHLGVDAVLATELEASDDGTLTGRLAGPNVRGDEKVRRLDEWLVGRPAHVVAYGDSAGDRALWARADQAVRLGRRAHRGTG